MEEYIMEKDRKREIKKIIIDNLELQMKVDDIGDDIPLFTEEDKGLGLDSIEALQVITGLEDYYDITIETSDDPQKDFYDINAIDRLVERCKKVENE